MTATAFEGSSAPLVAVLSANEEDFRTKTFLNARLLRLVFPKVYKRVVVRVSYGFVA